MSRRKEKVDITFANSFHEVVKKHEEMLNTNDFSLEVDPENLYSFTEEQKVFLKMYILTKDRFMVGKMMGLPEDRVSELFYDYNMQKEMYRLDLVLRQRQFHTKMLTADEISSWLSSLITDENVPVSERLNFEQKMRATDLLLRLQETLAVIMNSKSKAENTELLSKSLSSLSTSTIKALLSSQKTIKNEVIELDDERRTIINELKKSSLLTEDETLKLDILSLDELKQLLELKEVINETKTS